MLRFNWIASLIAVIACGAVGCGNSTDYKPVAVVKKANPLPDHDHGEKGPHGGGIVELGKEEYHAEILVDHDSHAVVVYVLGKDAKTAEPVDAQEITVTPEGKTALTLKAAPQKGDPDGKASKFELVDNGVVHDLMDAGFVHGDLSIKIGENSFTGHIDYHMDGSDHHDHDHDKKAPEGGDKK